MNVDVTKDIVKILEDSNTPNENEYKITICYFNFDEFTDSFQVKRAIFTILSTGEMYENDIINNECDIPSEVLKHEYETIKLGVYGYNIGENEELLNRFSPSYDTFIVPTGSYEEGAISPEPITPSQYDIYSQQLQEGLQEVDDKLEEVDGKIIEIDEAIKRTENLDIDAEKTGKITSVTITRQDGTTKTVDIEDGIGLLYNWLGTSLGIKREDEQNYIYVDLQGPQGQPGSIRMVIVNQLPIVGEEGILYFVPKEEPEESDMYDEYTWLNNEWELLGEKQIEIDLDDYYTKQEVNSLIPTTLSQLGDDSTHRLVTDSEKNTWNNKSDFSGNYNDLTNKPTIPSKTSDLTNDSDYTTKTYVDGLVGNINTALDTINGEVI